MGVRERSVKRLIKVCSLSERSREDGYQSVRTHKHTSLTLTYTLSHTCMKYRWRWGGSEGCKW